MRTKETSNKTENAKNCGGKKTTKNCNSKSSGSKRTQEDKDCK